MCCEKESSSPDILKSESLQLYFSSITNIPRHVLALEESEF